MTSSHAGRSAVPFVSLVTLGRFVTFPTFHSLARDYLTSPVVHKVTTRSASCTGKSHVPRRSRDYLTFPVVHSLSREYFVHFRPLHFSCVFWEVFDLGSALIEALQRQLDAVPRFSVAMHVRAGDKAMGVGGMQFVGSHQEWEQDAMWVHRQSPLAPLLTVGGWRGTYANTCAWSCLVVVSTHCPRWVLSCPHLVPLSHFLVPFCPDLVQFDGLIGPFVCVRLSTLNLDRALVF
jgi:hypothetical protein